jgi:hypothetical protein
MTTAIAASTGAPPRGADLVGRLRRARADVDAA